MSLNLPAELSPLTDEFKDIFDNYAHKKRSSEESRRPVDEIEGNLSSDSGIEVGNIPDKLENMIACRKLPTESQRAKCLNRAKGIHKKVDSYKIEFIDDILSLNEKDE